MFITKMALPRRTFLRGLGTTLALPFLDAMVPALSAARSAKAPPRLGFVYISNGVIQDQWNPTTVGPKFELSPILQPLAPVRDQINVLSGLVAGNFSAFWVGGITIGGLMAVAYGISTIGGADGGLASVMIPASTAIFAFGLLLMVLGLASLIFAFVSTLAMVTLNGVFFLVAGAAEIGVGMHAKTWGRFFLWVIGGILYIGAGIFCILEPIAASTIASAASGSIRFFSIPKIRALPAAVGILPGISTAITCAPSSANSAAVARPMPDAAPVTMAARSFKRMVRVPQV